MYGVASAAAAMSVPATPVDIATEPVFEPREVRLVVVSDGAPAELDEVMVQEEAGAEIEAELEEAAEPVERLSDVEAEELLGELMEEARPAPVEEVAEVAEHVPAPVNRTEAAAVRTVPFFSQFADISATNWQKVSCGIAAISMLIDYYEPDRAVPDSLLQQGIAAGYFLSDAGWTHQGLINLSNSFGLDGYSRSMAELSMATAFAELQEVLVEGPVMASVHYTFEPTNPIPHLVVVNDVADGKVFYNDPAEASGGGSISIEKFQRAWKKRYIEIRPQG